MAGLTPDTFTTDVRYDLYQAIAALSNHGGYYAPEQVAAELRTRMAAVPAYALVNYGGATGLFAHAYLARLASTEVSGETATATASILVQEDAHFRAMPDRAVARAQAPAPARQVGHHQRETKAAGPALPQPLPQPGPDAAVVQRM